MEGVNNKRKEICKIQSRAWCGWFWFGQVQLHKEALSVWVFTRSTPPYWQAPTLIIMQRRSSMQTMVVEVAELLN